MRRFAAVIVAAGYSSRMGDFKPLLLIKETPAILHLLAKISSVRAAEIDGIVVVTGYKHDDIERCLSDAAPMSASRPSKTIKSDCMADEAHPDGQHPDIHTLYNQDYADGMFSSVCAGLKFATDRFPDADIMVFPADTPLVSNNTIDMLTDEFLQRRQEDRVCLIPSFLGKKGHPLLIPCEAVSAILSYRGSGGLKGAMAHARMKTHVVETGDEGAVLDMDTPDDYRDILLADHNLAFRHTAEMAEISTQSDALNRMMSSIGFDRYKRVFLVRHGEIEQHSGKILLGQTDVPLSETGRREAVSAGNALDALGVEQDARVVASDLSRTAETARIIAEILKVKEQPELYSGLREIDLGSWDGRFKNDVKDEFPDEYQRRGEDFLSWKDAGGENYYDVRYRVLKTLRRIIAEGCRQPQSADLIIVTHAGPIRAINSAAGSKSFDELMAWRVPRCVPLSLDGTPWQ